MGHFSPGHRKRPPELDGEDLAARLGAPEDGDDPSLNELRPEPIGEDPPYGEIVLHPDIFEERERRPYVRIDPHSSSGQAFPFSSEQGIYAASSTTKNPGTVRIPAYTAYYEDTERVIQKNDGYAQPWGLVTISHSVFNENRGDRRYGRVGRVDPSKADSIRARAARVLVDKFDTDTL